MQNYIPKLSLGLAISAMSAGAFAQEIRQLEEVVVTATKREVDAQSLPAAIDVYTPEQLEDAGVTSIRDLNMINSGFKMNIGSGTNQVAVRGVGAFINGGAVDGTTAVIIDDAYTARMYAFSSSVVTLDDVESVQVLKGPQGTLYGRNATAGAVVVQTFKPEIGQELSGRVSATLGDFGTLNYNGRFATGLGENFAASFSFGHTENDGFIDCLNCPGPDIDADDSDAYKLKLLWEPTESMKFEFTGLYGESETTHNMYQQVGHTDDFAGAALGLNNAQVGWFSIASAFLPAVGVNLDPTDPAGAVNFGTLIGMASGLTFTDGADGGLYTQGVGATSYNVGLNPLISDQVTLDHPRQSVTENESFNLKATFSFENFDLVSTTNYNEFRQASHGDVLAANPASLPDLTVFSPAPGDPTNPITATLSVFNNQQIGFSGFTNSDNFTQEAYLVSTDSDIEWIAGVFYFNEDITISVANDLFGTNSIGVFNDMEIESLAAYAEATFPLSATWSLTAGMRYTDETNDLTDRVGTLGLAQTGGVPVPDVGNLDYSDDQWTYNLRLNYQADKTLLYGGITTGFKSGQINATAPLTGSSEAEEMTSYEFGFKGDYVDDLLRVNGAVFYYDYDNIQLSIIDPQGANVVANGAVAEVLGLELDVQALVSDNTTLFANTTILDHELTDNPVTSNGGTQDVRGNGIPLASDYVVVAGVQHRIPTSMGVFGLNLTVNHNSGFYIDQLNTFGSSSDGDEDDAYTLANAAITFESPNDGWKLRAYVNNLTDEEYFQGGTEVFGSIFQIAAAGRGRHYGLQATYEF